MNSFQIAQIAVVTSFVITLAVNTAANALPLNGQTTGEISDRFPSLFVPAGYVFSIWGLIYIALLVFTVYQALPAQASQAAIVSVRWWVVALNLLNAVWLVLWHYERFSLTVPTMLAILGTLIVIYLRLDTGGFAPLSGELWLVQFPFSIYLGWISVATIANVSQWLYSIGWDGWGLSGATWAVLMIGTAVALAAAMLVMRRDPLYGLVIIWALIGIAQKQADTATVSRAAWLGSFGLALFLAVYSLAMRRG